MDILNKLSILTTIDRKDLSKLFEKINWCICDNIYDNFLENNYKCEFDIEIGKLIVDFSSGDSVRYKFIPSKELEKNIENTIINKQNPLTLKAEQSLVRKLTNTYKDLF